jgi:intracellular septation protein A
VDGVLHLGSIRAHLRHAAVPVLEGVIGPFVAFYLVLVAGGFQGACIAAFAWSCLALARRIVRRERISGTLLIGTGLTGLRTVTGLVSHSAFLYFLQPTAGTYLIALAFLVSALLRRPLTERLAHDYCPIDQELAARPFVRQFFVRISLLWGIVMLANASFVLWLLFTSSLRAFVVERTAVSWVLTGAGIVVSTFWFRRAMRRQGITVRFRRVPIAAA